MARLDASPSRCLSEAPKRKRDEPRQLGGADRAVGYFHTTARAGSGGFGSRVLVELGRRQSVESGKTIE